MAYIRRNPKRHNDNDNGNAWQKKRRKDKPFEAWCASLVFQSRKRGMPYDLDPEFLADLWQKQNGKCHWLKMPMELHADTRNPRKANVDRLEPAFGYIKGNVVWACRFANVGRGDFPVEEFSQFLSERKNV